LIETFQYNTRSRGVLTDMSNLADAVWRLLPHDVMVYHIKPRHIKMWPKLVQAAALHLLKAGPFELTSAHIAATFPAEIVVDVTWRVIPAVDANADKEED
jgi:hypothetical protein